MLLDRLYPGSRKAPEGRTEPVPTAERHFVNGRGLKPPYPEGMELAIFGMGCFWGAERIFWTREGVWVTAVGYAGGMTLNPTYREVCSGRSEHAEAVLVVFDPDAIPYADLLRLFWESHDPTQLDRQGNDIGTQYRSVIFPASDAQREEVEASRGRYQHALEEAGRGPVETRTEDWPEFYYAEEYHQQYLARNPNGYCGIGGTGISCPIPATSPQG